MKKHHALIACALVLTGCAPAAPTFETSPTSTEATATPTESVSPLTEPVEFLNLTTGDAVGTVQIISFEKSQCGNENLSKVTFEIANTSHTGFTYVPTLWRSYKDEENAIPDGGFNETAQKCATQQNAYSQPAQVNPGESKQLDVILDTTNATNIGIRMRDDVQLLRFNF